LMSATSCSLCTARTDCLPLFPFLLVAAAFGHGLSTSPFRPPRHSPTSPSPFLSRATRASGHCQLCPTYRLMDFITLPPWAWLATRSMVGCGISLSCNLPRKGSLRRVPLRLPSSSTTAVSFHGTSSHFPLGFQLLLDARIAPRRPVWVGRHSHPRSTWCSASLF
jgi:hypothetical protein